MIRGIGIDIVDVKRMDKLIQRYSRQALGKLFTRHELTHKKAQNLAGKFAAKEALAKALGCGLGEQIWFNQIEIRNDKSGKPYFSKTRRLSLLLKKMKAKKTLLSISHEKEWAVAFVMIE